MALRGTLTHWKTRLLAQSLGIMPCHALGILEALWHTTAELAPAGNIGRLPNQAIAMEMFYEGDADELVKSLIESKHLETNEMHRLIVHDWAQHADYNTKRKVERRNESIIANGGSGSVMTRHKSIPVPEPVPVPEPEPVKKTRTSSLEKATDAEVLRVYEVYPHKVGKGDAVKSIAKALASLRKRNEPDPEKFLVERIQGWIAKRERDRAAGKFVPEYPNPATWFNGCRYDDEDNLPKSKRDWKVPTDEENAADWNVDFKRLGIKVPCLS